MCPTIFLTNITYTAGPAVSFITNNYTDILNNLDEYCTQFMASGKYTGILASISQHILIIYRYIPTFIMCILDVYTIYSLLNILNNLFNNNLLGVFA